MLGSLASHKTGEKKGENETAENPYKASLTKLSETNQSCTNYDISQSNKSQIAARTYWQHQPNMQLCGQMAGSSGSKGLI